MTAGRQFLKLSGVDHVVHKCNCQIALLIKKPSLPAVSHAEGGHPMSLHRQLLWLLEGRVMIALSSTAELLCTGSPGLPSVSGVMTGQSVRPRS